MWTVEDFVEGHAPPDEKRDASAVHIMHLGRKTLCTVCVVTYSRG